MNKGDDISIKDVHLPRISFIMDVFYCQVSSQR